MFLLHLRADVAHGDHLVVLHIVLENGQPSVGQFNTYFDISTLANKDINLPERKDHGMDGDLPILALYDHV